MAATKKSTKATKKTTKQSRKASKPTKQTRKQTAKKPVEINGDVRHNAALKAWETRRAKAA